MKRPILNFFVVILTLSLGLLSHALLHHHEHTTSRVEAEAINLTYEFYEAIERDDKQALSNITADDCKITTNRNFLVDDKPFTVGKAELLIIESTNPQHFSISTININTRDDKTKVTVSGDLLLSKQQANTDISYRFNHTYVNRQGRLQLVSAELTRQDWPPGWSHKQR